MPPIHVPKRQTPAPGRWWSLQHVRPYVLAVFFVAVATLARWLLRPLAGNELPYITYFAAVFVSAWRLGWRPTVLAVSLSALLTAVFFLPPVTGGGASGLLSLTGLTLFIAIGLGSGIVGEGRLQALRLAREQAAEAVRLQGLAEEAAAEAEESALQAEEDRNRAEAEARRADEQVALTEAALAQVRSIQTQLLHAQQLDAIGQLAGGVAHDFNNILTAIAGYCGFLLADTPPGDRRRDDIVGIREAADRAAALTQQLLAFGRKQMMQPAILDVREVIEDAGRLLRRLIAEDIELVITTGPILSSVLADRGQLGQVLVNLAVNARDAMPEGGRLTIEARDEPLGEGYAETHLAIEPGPYVRIAVSDTGRGMTPEVRAHIFEPFFTTKPAGKGTGLGLSTVYGIVKQFGGHVLAYSEPGHGTTVKVYLPRAEGVAAATTREESPPLRAGLETILVVEDDEVIRKVARRVLEMQSYTVLMASTPTEALEVAAQFEGRIDLLLTDVILPGVTGPRLAELLLFGRPGLPVLYMSGYADDAIVLSGQLAPDTEFLSKPFTPDTLLRRVRQTLDQHGAAGAAASA
jgi:signal transduction histidine kinase/ActR/RegA family two-component response regulator